MSDRSDEVVTIVTPRLRLRRWRESDREPFARLNADPDVMEFLPAPLTRKDSDDLAQRIETRIEKNGYGLWAVEVVGAEPFIGFVGLNPATFEAPFTPAIEVGWRLAKDAWGHGYATEAAQASVAFGFERLALDEIVSFTVRDNRRSRAVMERLGMTHDSVDDFEHPALPCGSPLRPHVLYRLRREAWEANA